MAEIVGTISAALTFIDFIHKIGQAARKVQGSVDDGIGEYDRLQTITRSLADGISSLENNNATFVTSGPHGKPATGAIADSVRQAIEVSKTCLRVVNDIMMLIDKVSEGLKQPSPPQKRASSRRDKLKRLLSGTPSSIHSQSTGVSSTQVIPIDTIVQQLRKKLKASWTGTKVTLAVMWHESELEGLRKEFDSCASLLAFHWNAIFSLKIINMLDDQASALKSAPSEVNGLADKIVSLSSTLKEMREGSKIQSRYIEEMSSKLQGLLEAGKSTLVQLSEYWILSSVRFKGMKARQDDISQGAPETLDWIYGEALEDDFPHHKDLTTTFSSWLKSGRGVFNITGKPGSGKSTLMKHLVTRRLRKTKSLLEENANGKTVLVATSYFWMLGQFQQQRSFTGLVRSILYELLEQAPELIPIVFAKHLARGLNLPCTHHTIDISTEEFEEALLRALQIGGEKYYICIFIDAADELQDNNVDFTGLATKIDAWSQVGIAQICVFSREESAFMRVFPASQRIRLHLVNQESIRRMVENLLNDHSLFIQEPEVERNKLINDTSKQAEGVFLWAYLVVREMREKLESARAPRIPKLRRVLHWLPPKLEDCFEKILVDRILPSSDRNESCLILQLVATLKGLRNSIELGSWVYSRVAGIVNKQSDRLVPDSEAGIHERTIDFKSRVYGLFRGLLEIGPFESDLGGEEPYELTVFYPPLQFIHRSIYDFLQKNTVKSVLQGLFSEDQVACIFLECLIVCTKSLPPRIDDFTSRLQPTLVEIIPWLHGLEYSEKRNTLVLELDDALLHSQLGSREGNIDWDQLYRFASIEPDFYEPWTKTVSIFVLSHQMGSDMLSSSLGANGHWSGRKELQPALLDAVLWPLIKSPRFEEEIPCDVINATEALTSFLRAGFDLNQPVRIGPRRLAALSDSIWLNFLHDMIWGFPANIFSAVGWYVIEHLLKHGADARVTLQWRIHNRCSNCWMEAIEVWDTAAILDVKLSGFIKDGEKTKKILVKTGMPDSLHSVPVGREHIKLLDLYPTKIRLRDIAEYLGKKDLALFMDEKIKVLEEHYPEDLEEENTESKDSEEEKWQVEALED
ncbi:hypothetical protein QBC43DRAFT_322955 [Cladorrhinum sp. PSN259]|nr:hypothetical protein QBC43DRAFT_322955 [Cladorrhinum sp. PSN259]